MKVYLFDVDETLEISGGPVKLQALMDLRIAGHAVGLNGNWAALVSKTPGWQHLISFFNVGLPKDAYIAELRRWIAAEEFVMVGNILGVSGGSDDYGAAQRAGIRFIKESDFARGVR